MTATATKKKWSVTGYHLDTLAPICVTVEANSPAGAAEEFARLYPRFVITTWVEQT